MGDPARGVQRFDMFDGDTTLAGSEPATPVVAAALRGWELCARVAAAEYVRLPRPAMLRLLEPTDAALAARERPPVLFVGLEILALLSIAQVVSRVAAQQLHVLVCRPVGAHRSQGRAWWSVVCGKRIVGVQGASTMVA